MHTSDNIGLDLTVVGVTRPAPRSVPALLDGLGKAHAHAGVADDSAKAEIEFDSVSCPECAGPATVEWRSLRGTNGKVEHAKVRCPRGHWFLMPASWLVQAPA